MATQNLTVAARKPGNRWEAALVVDGKFMRAFTGGEGDTLMTLIGATLTALLSVDRNEGTEVALNITLAEPDAQ